MAHGDYALFFTNCDLKNGIFLRSRKEKKGERRQGNLAQAKVNNYHYLFVRLASGRRRAT